MTSRKTLTIVASCILGLALFAQHSFGEDGETTPKDDSNPSNTTDQTPNLRVFKLPPNPVTYHISNLKSKTTRIRFVLIRRGTVEKLAHWDITQKPFVGKIKIFTEHEGELPPYFSRCPMSWIIIGIAATPVWHGGTGLNDILENPTGAIEPSIIDKERIKLVEDYRGMKKAARVDFYAGLGDTVEIEGMHTGTQGNFGEFGQAKQTESPDKNELLIAAWSRSNKMKFAKLSDMVEHT